ncbi:hypothetical protein SK128_023361, partial [Halocaridina rubra]
MDIAFMAHRSQRWCGLCHILYSSAQYVGNPLPGETAISFAAQVPGPLSIIKLIEHGASIDKTNVYGFTPLLWASRAGLTENVGALINGGADVNKENIYGDTPLMWATLAGSKDTVRLLLKNGADPNKATHQNVTALMGATTQGDTDIMSILLAAGANKHTETPYGLTALGISIQTGNAAAIKLLVDADIVIHQNINGTTPLHEAVKQNDSYILFLVLDTCPDFTATDKDNETALELANNLQRTEYAKIIQDYIYSTCYRYDQAYKEGDVIYQNCEELICHCGGRWELGEGYDPNC